MQPEMQPEMQTFARGEVGGVSVHGASSRKHTSAGPRRTRTDSREGRETATAVRTAAPGPGKANARTAPLHTCACAQAGAELLEEEQLRSAFAPASASFSPGSSAAALKARPLAPRHVEMGAFICCSSWTGEAAGSSSRGDGGLTAPPPTAGEAAGRRPPPRHGRASKDHQVLLWPRARHPAAPRQAPPLGG